MAVNITHGGGGGGGDAEVRVGTLKIQADRVQADLGDNRTLNFAGPRGERPNDRRASRPPAGRAVTQEPRSDFNKLQSRCCFGFAAVPFAVALALLSVGIVTFVLKNRDAVNHCDLNCSLVCDSLSSSIQHNSCYVAYASGGVASLVAVILVFILLVKVCLGSKILHWFVVVELFVLACGLGGAILLSLLFDQSDGYECLQGRCTSDLDLKDWTDFMEQAKYCAWAGAGIMSVMAILWLVLSLSTCCVAYGQRIATNGPRERRRQQQGGRRYDERQPLLQN